MGKGSNLQKKQAARARHEKESKGPEGGGGKAGMASRTGANAAKIVCNICRVFYILNWIIHQTEFLATQSTQQLQGHVDAKHPKLTFAQCFPTRA